MLVRIRRQFVLAYLLALKNTKRYANANSLKLAPYEVSKWNVRDRAASGQDGLYRVGVLLHASSATSVDIDF
jgi:hypothetical protein